MPYIDPKDRTEKIITKVDVNGFASANISRQDAGEIVGNFMRNGGDLQYMLAVAIQTYLEKTGLRYQNCQDIMGALTGANAEFIRKVVSPYEDKKISDNGGVYNISAMKQKGY